MVLTYSQKRTKWERNSPRETTVRGQKFKNDVMPRHKCVTSFMNGPKFWQKLTLNIRLVFFQIAKTQQRSLGNSHGSKHQVIFNSIFHRPVSRDFCSRPHLHSHKLLSNIFYAIFPFLRVSSSFQLFRSYFDESICLLLIWGACSRGCLNLMLLTGTGVSAIGCVSRFGLVGFFVCRFQCVVFLLR